MRHVPRVSLRPRTLRTAAVIALARHTSRIGTRPPYLHTFSWIFSPRPANRRQKCEPGRSRTVRANARRRCPWGVAATAAPPHPCVRPHPGPAFLLLTDGCCAGSGADGAASPRAGPTTSCPPSFAVRPNRRSSARIPRSSPRPTSGGVFSPASPRTCSRGRRQPPSASPRTCSRGRRQPPSSASAAPWTAAAAVLRLPEFARRRSTP